MEIKDWLPIIGLVIGWLLSQIGIYFRDTREERQLLSIAISGLLYSYFDRVRYRQILKVLNQRLGDKLEEISKMETSSEDKIELNNRLLAEIEGARQSLIKDHPDTEERNNESLSLSLKSISKVDPILGYQSKILIEDDQLYKNADISKLLTRPLVYLEAYGALVGSIDSHSAELSMIIKKAALRHGILCFLRTLILLWRENRRLTTCDDQANKFFDAFEEAANVQNTLNN